MAKGSQKHAAIVGVADHAGWAVVVTVAGGALVDRRRVELVDAALPKLPHHHEAQILPLRQGLELIERVRASANKHAARALADLPGTVGAIAIRECPPMPATVAECIKDYRAQCVADTVMYRMALAQSAKARGWAVHWYDARRVTGQAAQALGRDSIEELLKETGSKLGPPWTKDHRVAMAAAIAAHSDIGKIA